MRKATPEEFELFARMRNTITSNARRNQLRTLYAEFEHVVHHRSFRSVWTDVEVEQVPLGWPAKAARVFGGRFSPRPFHFRSGSSLADDLAEAHEMASGVAVEGMAIKASVRHGLGFVFTSAGLPGEPEVISTVRSARQATAIIDPRTRRTTAALEDIGDGWWLLYLPHVVLRVSRRLDGILIVDGEYPTGTRRVLCTPFINDLDAERPYGSSRITREQMELTNAGIRTLSRSEVSAEFYQAPKQDLIGAVTLVGAERQAGERVYAAGPAWDLFHGYFGMDWAPLESEAEWQAALAEPGPFLLVVAFPGRMLRTIPGIEAAETAGALTLVKAFPGTLGDGYVLVYRRGNDG